MLRLHLGNEGLKSGKEETPGHVFSSGVPSNLSKVRRGSEGGGKINAYRKILKISSISESPGKSGLRVHISAKIAPTDHISTPVEY